MVVNVFISKAYCSSDIKKSSPNGYLPKGLAFGCVAGVVGYLLFVVYTNFVCPGLTAQHFGHYKYVHPVIALVA